MKSFLIFLLIICTQNIFAQDPAFSQLSSAPLLVNPAFAGSWASGRATTSYRLQWPKLSSCYQTTNVSYDQYINHCGLGFNYMHDDAARGVLKTDRFDFSYSPYFALLKDSTGKGKIIIQLGLEVSYFQKKLDNSKLNFGDMIDPRRGFIYFSNEVPNTLAKSNIDLSSGLLIYSKRFATGFATYHLTEPDDGYMGPSKLPMRFVFHASGILGNLNDSINHLRIIPSVIFMQQQDFRSIVINVNATYSVFNLGIGFRNQDAIIFSAGYNHGYTFAGYSYDMTISDLAGTSGGTHEIHIGVRFANKKWSSRRTNLQMFN